MTWLSDIVLWIPRRIGDLLLFFAGIDRHEVNDPSDRARYSSAALAMVLYGAYATAAGATVMSIVTHTGTVRWLPVAGGFALMVMLFDRVVLSHVSADLTQSSTCPNPVKRLGFGYFFTRILLALLLAFVVTESLGSVIYRDEIGQVLSDLSRAKVGDLNKTIDAQLATDTAPLGPAGNQAQLDADRVKGLRDEVDRFATAATNESSGHGRTSTKTCGTVCQRLIDKGNTAQEKLTTALDDQSKNAMGRSGTIAALTTTAETKKNDNIVNPPQIGGILNEQRALWNVLGDNPATLTFYIPLSLLLVVLDLSVVIIKFMSRGSLYEWTAARAKLVRKEETSSLQTEFEAARIAEIFEKRGHTVSARRDKQDKTAELRKSYRDWAYELKREKQRKKFERKWKKLSRVVMQMASHPPTAPAPTLPATAPEPPDVLGGRWRLTGPLPSGEVGNIGKVWLGSDLKNNYGDVVVKVTVVNDPVHDQAALNGALAEMDVSSRSRYVAELLDRADPNDRVLWTVSPFYELGSLHHYYRDKPLRPLRQVLAVADHILDGLASVTRAHGDLKPTNIVVEKVVSATMQGLPNLNDLHIRLIDWGQSTVWNQIPGNLTPKEGGTKLWRSPEQRRQERIDPRSDLYAVGVLLYWLATGFLPFEGEVAASEFTEAALEKLQREGGRPEPLNNLIPKVPSNVGSMVEQFMAYAPEARFPRVRPNGVIKEARDLLGKVYEEVEAHARADGADIQVGPGLF